MDWLLLVDPSTLRMEGILMKLQKVMKLTEKWEWRVSSMQVSLLGRVAPKHVCVKALVLSLTIDSLTIPTLICHT
jgi:hypothetical protein